MHYLWTNNNNHQTYQRPFLVGVIAVLVILILVGVGLYLYAQRSHSTHNSGASHSANKKVNDANQQVTEKYSGSNQDKIVQDNNAFAIDLYHRLASENGNLFFSPYSISSVLAMTYSWARGRTEEEMVKWYMVLER